eukprot:748439-Hanusia_phi.AAC.4
MNSAHVDTKSSSQRESENTGQSVFVQEGPNTSKTQVMEVADGRHFVRYVGGPHEGDSYDGFFRSTTSALPLALLDTSMFRSNGVKHGPGIYTWASGDKFEGEYVDDFKHG